VPSRLLCCDALHTLQCHEPPSHPTQLLVCCVCRWKEKLKDLDVVVMTPELLLHCLAHASLQVRYAASQKS
jgi:hypothetical protein